MSGYNLRANCQQNTLVHVLNSGANAALAPVQTLMLAVFVSVQHAHEKLPNLRKSSFKEIKVIAPVMFNFFSITLINFIKTYSENGQKVFY